MRREFAFEVKEIVRVRDIEIGYRDEARVVSGVYWEDINGNGVIVLDDDKQNGSKETKGLAKRFINKFIGGR